MSTPASAHTQVGPLQIRGTLTASYGDVLTPAALAAIEALAPFDRDRAELMRARTARRAARAAARTPIGFLDPATPSSGARRSAVADARAGRFDGGEIPGRPRPAVDSGHRPGRPARRAARDQPAQRRLRPAVGRRRLDVRRRGRARPGVDDVARQPAQPGAGAGPRAGVPRRRREGRRRDERVGGGASSAGRSSPTGEAQLDTPCRSSAPAACTSTTATSAGPTAPGFSASIVDLALYVANNLDSLAALPAAGGAVPAEDPDRRRSGAVARHPVGASKRHLRRRRRRDQGLRAGRAARSVLPADGDPRRAGRATSSASTPGAGTTSTASPTRVAWDAAFQNPNIDAITMTYGYMRAYEDRVRRAVNTPDRHGRMALWQGGMEPNIPVGSAAGVQAGMARAVAGAERERAAGASGKWVAHWKMVHIVRPVWEKAGEANQRGRAFPAAHLHRRRRRGAAHAGRRRRARCAAPATCSASPSSTATPSARACRRRRSSRPTSSATTTCST